MRGAPNSRYACGQEGLSYKANQCIPTVLALARILAGQSRMAQNARPTRSKQVAREGKALNSSSAGKQLLNALVRETEDFCRVPHRQVSVAD